MRDAIRGNQRPLAHLLEEYPPMRDAIRGHQRPSAHLLEERLLMRDAIRGNQRPSAHLLEELGAPQHELVKEAVREQLVDHRALQLTRAQRAPL